VSRRGRLLPLLFVLGATSTYAQDAPEPVLQLTFGSDYDALTEELPIESEVFGPPLTFTNSSGGVTTFYGQVNLTYQSFDDGQQTTSNIVDNGNWNSRLGFTISQPFGENTLRARFETGLTMRNTSLVSQTQTPDWGDWERTLLRWFEVALDSNYGTFSLGQGRRRRTARRGWTTVSPSSPGPPIPPTASPRSGSGTIRGT
jgi:hypothetical protein